MVLIHEFEKQNIVKIMPEQGVLHASVSADIIIKTLVRF